MIIATLYMNSLNKLKFIEDKFKNLKKNEEKEIKVIFDTNIDENNNNFKKNDSNNEDLKKNDSNNDDLKKNDTNNTNLLNGNYKLILRLLRILSNGELNKSIVDIVIDENNSLQNLREAILEFKGN
jgi:hypothetical protein